jgi:predicted aspartyl protease
MPKTIKIVGYINNQNVIVLIDLGSTHTLINKNMVYKLDCDRHPFINFQVVIVNGGKCHNIKLSRLQIINFHLNHFY